MVLQNSNGENVTFEVAISNNVLEEAYIFNFKVAHSLFGFQRQN